MSSTLQVIRQRVARILGIYESGTSSSAGAAAGASAICNTIRNRKDDFYNGWFLKVPSLSAPNSQEVEDFEAASGTFFPETAFSAQVDSGVAIELYRYDPDLIDQAIQETIRGNFPSFNQWFVNDHLISGDWLRNGNFEEWTASTVPDSWSKTASLTCAKETSTKWYGANALKTTNTAATQWLSQSETELPELLDLRGKSVTFRVWCKTATASHARLVIQTTDDGGTTTTTYSGFHTGSDRREILYIESCNIPDDVRNIQFQLSCAVNAIVAYWDQARVTGKTKREYYLPSNTQIITEVFRQVSGDTEDNTDPCDDLGLDQTFYPVNAWEVVETGTRKLRIPGALSEGYKIRLKGLTLCTVPTTDTGTTEIDSPALDYLIPLTCLWLIKNLGGSTAATDRSYLTSRRAEFEAEALRQRQHRHLFPPIQVRTGKV